MSEPVTKQRPTVDLDDFERVMRDAHYHHDDPLAELARLVGEQPDPYGDVFAREAVAPAHQAQAYPASAAASHDSRREPAFGAPSASPRLSGDFAAIEAGLRGAVPGHDGYAHHQAEPTFDASYEHEQGHDYDGAHGFADPTAYDPAWAQPPRATRSSRRPAYLLAATIAVGVIGIGTAFALKGHIATSPREVKTILADESPTKVQPPADAVPADTQASQDAGVLGRGQTAPTALANSQEQPVDLLQAARENAAAQARRSDASSVPVPQSPGQMQTAMADPASAGQSFPINDMPAPKRVRVVSVRPDGTILPNDNPPPAAMPAPRAPAGKTSDRAGPVAKPSTPKAANKTTSRVTTPKSLDQLADAPDDAAAVPAAKVKKPKPQRVASADTGEAEATQVVSPEPEASVSGGFAVQLAAPGSESDAKATSSRLAKKFAGPLGSHHLGFHKAESNGKSVFRVRVSSLSKPDAVSLCEKLKADGGSCFVAKN